MKSITKKLTAFVATVALAGGFTGCGGAAAQGGVVRGILV